MCNAGAGAQYSSRRCRSWSHCFLTDVGAAYLVQATCSSQVQVRPLLAQAQTQLVRKAQRLAQERRSLVNVIVDTGAASPADAGVMYPENTDNRRKTAQDAAAVKKERCVWPRWYQRLRFRWYKRQVFSSALVRTRTFVGTARDLVTHSLMADLTMRRPPLRTLWPNKPTWVYRLPPRVVGNLTLPCHYDNASLVYGLACHETCLPASEPQDVTPICGGLGQTTGLMPLTRGC